MTGKMGMRPITIDDRLLSDGTKHVIHFEEIEADRAYEKI
jgi:hypothetical protein